MLIRRSVRTARLLAIAAVLTLAAFPVFGWWVLALSIGLASISALAVRRSPRHGRSRRLSDLIASVERRLNPHIWRPR